MSAVLDHTLHRFGQFIIVRTLGRGGMGEVFVARTPWDKTPIAAVKRLRPDVARVPTFAERFKHEAELAVRLNHLNVVGTLDVGSVEGQLYVCSELVLGKDTGVIADRLRERGQGGPAAVAIRLLVDTLAGLAYVHGASEPDGRPLMLVHRDVTPGNVLVGYDGIARLADFGLAKSLLTEGSKLTNHGEILGTPHYLAPEVIKGEGAGPASDLYGLGAVMYRFLTGVAPHQGTTAEVLLKVLSQQPRPLSDLRPDLPPWIVAFIHRMLETDPSRRPSDATVLLKQLTHDARASGLMVPRSSVARWIGNLFEPEKADELEERDRIAAIVPSSIPDKPEGTVVLAHPRAGSRLEAPQAAHAEDHADDVDSQGTELELSENDVRAASSEERVPAAGVKRRPPTKGSDFHIGNHPSDVTDAAKRIDLDVVTFEDDSIHGMPTRAVTVYPGIFGGPKEGLPNDTQHDRPLLDPANTGLRSRLVPDDDTLSPSHQPSVLPRAVKPAGAVVPVASLDSAETHLPGFIDERPRRERPPTAAAAASPAPAPARDERPKEEDEPSELRRMSARKPDSVVVTPAAARPLQKPLKPPSAPFGPEPSSSRAAPHRSRAEPATVPPPPPSIGKPAGSTNPKAHALSPSTSGHARAQPSPAQGAGRNLIMLAALLAIAIAMGIGIGVLVASLKKPTPILVEAADSPAALLKRRLVRLKMEMDARSARGDAVPARAWELVANAGVALADNDASRAQAAIEGIEETLARPASADGGGAKTSSATRGAE